MRTKTLITLSLTAITILCALAYEPTRTTIEYIYTKMRGGYTVEERLEQYGSSVASRLRPYFELAKVNYPPTEVAYLAFKDTAQLEVYARSPETASWVFIRAYPIVQMSGKLGPKLREGDRQVPEGIYQSALLNPNSRYHLAIRVSYPNSFDQEMARLEGRDQLGGDIMIHGSSVSIGCLAMGNTVAEELFTLSALIAPTKTKIIISPTDFRLNPNYTHTEEMEWINLLYHQLSTELAEFKQ
ncbi:L,D-transpeptidase family protein [Thiofilum flexile]|uniref:L,D-transpeptidase family protein n=1 Tax=Thiofilum flexile TaxID=125627 RepID=UPI00036EBF44|nr:hypothetical protein [Thiofilum flexile]